jgi:GNAT-family acetyltransferase (TIGR03103 family)
MADNKNRPTPKSRDYSYRLKRMREHGLKPPIGVTEPSCEQPRQNFALDCGWGRLVFGQTYADATAIAQALRSELPDQRDIAFYIRNPHVLLAAAPLDLFLDPSHTYRLDLGSYRPSKQQPSGFFVRRLTSRTDAEEINRIYTARGMVQVSPDFFWDQRDARAITYFVAEDEKTGEILGTVTGIDHARAFRDPEHGSSLWCLAVDPQARQPGLGEALARRLAELFAARGCSFMDLSVLHDNEQAIALYEKLGFRRVPYFSVKRKNPINEQLFTGSETDDQVNPYARIIIREARRRGIHVDITDADSGYFRLSHGGRSIHCRESLSELTTSIAMSISDDKAVTRRFVEASGVKVPEQISAAAGDDEIKAFLARHGEVVVKPARGEQGRGISVGLTCMQEIESALEDARKTCDQVLIEQCVAGQDLRIVVINYEVVAAAIRKPAHVVGDGKSTVAELIEVQSRRRAAATDGESTIPLDEETRRTIARQVCELATVLEDGRELQVRKTANLHTGGTIHDVTASLHPDLAKAAIAAARAISIPVAGIDFMVSSPEQPGYWFIECNERPGLANHEPQPTAERFIDLLFPLSRRPTGTSMKSR